MSIDGKKYDVDKEIWKESEYFFNPDTEQMEERIVSQYTQYPISLAYAITIHKSQGKTFKKITVDIGNGAFASGQIYVALSRCTSLEGIVLNSQIRQRDIMIDPRIVEYYNNRGGVPAPALRIENNITSQITSAIENQRSLEISYQNFNGGATIRSISRIKFSDKDGNDSMYKSYIKAYCHLRNEDRVFKVDRIVRIT